MSEQTPSFQKSLDYINKIEYFLSKYAKDFERINLYQNGKLCEIKFILEFYNVKVIVGEKQVRIMFGEDNIMYLEEGINDFGLAFNMHDEGFQEFVTVNGFDFNIEVINEDDESKLIIRLIRTGNIEEESNNQSEEKKEEGDEE